MDSPRAEVEPFVYSPLWLYRTGGSGPLSFFLGGGCFLGRRAGLTHLGILCARCSSFLMFGAGAAVMGPGVTDRVRLEVSPRTGAAGNWLFRKLLPACAQKNSAERLTREGFVPQWASRDVELRQA
jgi:hypothetical protein